LQVRILPGPSPGAEQRGAFVEDRLQRVKDIVPQGRQFLTEVYTELRKVHWPTPREAMAATVVVIVVVMIVALWLGLVDGVVSFFMTRLLGG
jgi:preprotein translocase subunit SecE